MLAGAGLGAGTARAQNGGNSDVVRLKLEPGELSLGRSDAPLTMVEFTDYQCPYCRRFQAEVWPQLKRNYIDTGKLRYLARDLPLEFHSAAAPAAEAAHCAGEQGKFWDMHAALLAGDMDFASGGIERRARALQLDMTRFGECVARRKYAGLIAAHAREADAAGIDGTPGFIVGRASGAVLDGLRVEGALPYGEFAGLLNELLAAH
jgi:protein-disulfide isomerase